MNLKTDRQIERGFTLLEILLSMAITGMVITLTGSGLFALMNANQRSQGETTDRLELERALAFMTDEIKMSHQIMTDFMPINTKIPKFRAASGSSRIQPILVLAPAPTSKLTDPIIYYLADPPHRSVWLGPRVIYRWGPTLLQNGNYSDGSGHDLAAIPRGATVEYYNEVVVDRLSDKLPGLSDRNCDSGYNYSIPDATDRLGFYACVANDHQSVKLWIDKQPNSSGKSPSASTLVVTRSN